jgi:hypothetical protein
MDGSYWCPGNAVGNEHVPDTLDTSRHHQWQGIIALNNNNNRELRMIAVTAAAV